MKCTHDGCEENATTELRVKLGPGQFQSFGDFASCAVHAETRAIALKESLVDEPEKANAIQQIPRRN